jgi:uroporphyrinogen-III synthase
LPAALRAVGAVVTEIVAYQTGGLGRIDPAVMSAIRETEVDVISFFSPSAIENMRAELGQELLSRLGAKAKMAAVGPTTATALRDAGLTVAIQAPLATAESMAVAIATYFSTNTESKARAI